MKAFNHIQAFEEIENEKPMLKQNNSGFKNETTARKALVLLDSKEWAGLLDVSPQKVSLWKNGDKIPTKRMFEIAEESLKLYATQLDPLRSEITMMLLLQYGPNAREDN